MRAGGFRRGGGRRGRGGGSGASAIIIVILLLVIVAAAVWFFFLRDSGDEVEALATLGFLCAWRPQAERAIFGAASDGGRDHSNQGGQLTAE